VLIVEGVNLWGEIWAMVVLCSTVVDYFVQVHYFFLYLLKRHPIAVTFAWIWVFTGFFFFYKFSLVPIGFDTIVGFAKSYEFVIIFLIVAIIMFEFVGV